MNPMQLFVAVPAALFILGSGAANVGQTEDVAGAIACVNDEWTKSEPDKDTSWPILSNDASASPMDPAAPKFTQDFWGSTSTCQTELEGHRDLH